MTPATARKLPRALIAAALALASTVASFALTASPAEAAPRGGLYAATLASPLPQPRREIVDGAMWRCEGARCSASADGAQPMAICGKVSRRFGAVARFSTPRGEMTDAQLASCNGG